MNDHRELITAVHGMLFGAFFLLAVYALLVELLRGRETSVEAGSPRRGWQRAYLVTTAASGWLAVLSGTYLVYPWYRAVPPPGADLRNYPKSLLLSHPATASLHTIGMEWKEHIAFLAPIAFTMLAYVLCRYGSQIMRFPQMRRLLLTFSAVALLSTVAAGVFGALLNKAAPTTNSTLASQAGTGR